MFSIFLFFLMQVIKHPLRLVVELKEKKKAELGTLLACDVELANTLTDDCSLWHHYPKETIDTA